MVTIGLVVAWFACGFVAWGVEIADWRGSFPRDSTRDASGLAALMFLLGPIGILVVTIGSNFWQHGWRIR